MAKQILLAAGKKTALKKALNTSYPTVRAALGYESNTLIAKKIRHAAVKVFGGVETTDEKIER